MSDVEDWAAANVEGLGGADDVCPAWWWELWWWWCRSRGDFWVSEVVLFAVVVGH